MLEEEVDPNFGVLPKGSGMEFRFGQCVRIPKEKIVHDKKQTTLEPLGQESPCEQYGCRFHTARTH